MGKKIEGKTEVGNLKIENSGTHGTKLTIEIPNKGDISIVVDKFELAKALELKQKTSPKP